MKVTKNGKDIQTTEDDSNVKKFSLKRVGHAIFPALQAKIKGAVGSLTETLLRKETAEECKTNIQVTNLSKSADPAKASSQAVSIGRKPWPFDMFAIVNFQNQNIHHSRCLKTKANSTVGLGHVNKNTHTVLDKLCEISWLDVIKDAAEDYWQTGNGYIEVIRKGGGEEITGLHHVPAASVHVAIENANYDKHFEVDPLDGSGSTKIYADFGDRADAKTRLGTNINLGTNDELQEIIHLRKSTSLSRWYGFPDWISAVAAVELIQAILQYNFEFFINNCSPEFIAWITKGKLSKKDFDAIVDALMKSSGQTNQFKAHVFNLPDSNIDVRIDKLGLDQATPEGAFTNMLDALSIMVVSAHGVPPLLAGIQIPGKLGANNELPNSLVVFQTLVIEEEQNAITSRLDTTLGDPALNGGLSLNRGDFTFNTILDKIDVNKVANTSASRTPVGGNTPTGAPGAPEDGNTSVKPTNGNPKNSTPPA